MKTNKRFLWSIRSLIVLLFLGLCFGCSDSEDCDCDPTDPNDPSGEVPADIVSLSNDLLQLIDKAGGIDHFVMPDQTDYTSIPSDVNNLITDEKVLLGKLLFHDPATGVNVKNDRNLHTFSCATCHPSANEFQPGIPQGIGAGGWGYGASGEGRVPHPALTEDDLDVYSLRVPSTLNLAFSETMGWDGGIGTSAMNEGTEAYWTGEYAANNLDYGALETQCMGAAEKRGFAVDANWIFDHGYSGYFDAAFPSLQRSETYSTTYACLAIAAYLRSCITNGAPFQSFLKGDKMAMTKSQLYGAILFFDKAGCISCHTGTAFGNPEECLSLGLKDMDETVGIRTEPQEGRKAFTGLDSDYGKYKVPQLYNLKGVGYYGHGASMQGLRALIDYTVKGATEVPDFQGELPERFKDRDLSKTELDYIDDFVRNALYDANIERYTPDDVPSGLCIPSADPQSRFDLHCH